MLARQGAAVVVIDHVTKSKESRGLWAIGSQRKLAAIDGAAYQVDVKVSPTKTKDGKVTLTCAKDRNGTHQKGTVTANVAIDNAGSGIRVTATAPESKFRPTHYMEKVTTFLEDIPCASQRGILSAIPGRDSHIKAAIECLVDEGYVKCETTNRGNQYSLIATFRDGDEVETLTAATAANRGPEETAAVQSEPRTDRGHRGPDPLRSRGPRGHGPEALADTDHTTNTDDRGHTTDPVEPSTPDENPTTPDYSHVDF
jgi:hypothetical protein